VATDPADIDHPATEIVADKTTRARRRNDSETHPEVVRSERD
jgi:hypothetical protein